MNLVLNNLPPSYETFIESLNMLLETQTLTFQQVNIYLFQKQRQQLGKSASRSMESIFATTQWKRQNFSKKNQQTLPNPK